MYNHEAILYTTNIIHDKEGAYTCYTAVQCVQSTCQRALAVIAKSNTKLEDIMLLGKV